MNDILIKIETISYGQPRAHADSDYIFEITVENYFEHDVKEFCTKVLRPCQQTYSQWDTKNADSYFHGYYTFLKIGENKYRYRKLEPLRSENGGG